jgi:hypothetical protein
MRLMSPIGAGEVMMPPGWLLLLRTPRMSNSK